MPASDPWWRTHYTPNGFGCTCWVSAASAREIERKGYRLLKEAPNDGTYDHVDKKTGEIHTLPSGVDYGWDYAPGANANTALRELVQRKLVGYRPAIAKLLSRDVNRYINATDRPAEFARAVLRDGSRAEPLWLGFVEPFEAIAEQTGMDLQGYMVLLPAEAPRHIERSHGNDGQGQRPPQPEDYDRLQEIMTFYDAVKLGGASRHGHQTLAATKAIDGEVYRCVWEVLPGKRNRALALITMVIKT